MQRVSWPVLSVMLAPRWIHAMAGRMIHSWQMVAPSIDGASMARPESLESTGPGPAMIIMDQVPGGIE
ncbi:MAG: hypothetical protein CMJ32_04455 [Phycisphaerae bacterium]|nr:hypothetical protein [Phycisphaerae bacterium]MBC23150.1 hypothetical protein [Phycisphaerae bacterium]